jgi:hypothetical protein
MFLAEGIMKSVALAICLMLNTTPSPRPDPPAGEPPRVVAAPTKAPAPPVQVQDVKRWTVKWLEKPTFTFLWIAWGGRMISQTGGACPDYLTCSGGQSGVLGPDGQRLIAPSDDHVMEARKDGHILVRGGRQGFVDAEGRLLIEPKYDRVIRQGEGFFEVRSKEGRQLLTREGTVVLSGFEELSFEQETTIWVLRGERWSLHDLKGKPLVAGRYRELDVVSERTAAVRVGNRWALIDVTGRQLTPLRFSGVGVAVNGFLPFNEGGDCEEGDLDSCEGGRYGVLGEDGRTVLAAEHDCVEVLGIGEDDVELRVVTAPAGLEPDATLSDRCSGGRVRVLKKDGTPRFKESFAHLDALDGATHLRAVKDGVCDLNGNCESGKWGVLDVSGKVVVDYRYDFIDTLREDGTLFVLDGKWGLLDGAFQEVIPAKYEMLHVGKEALRFLEKGKWGILDRSGRFVAPARYEALLPFVKGVARFQENGKWGLISSGGQVLVPAKHKAICRPNLDTFLFANAGTCKVPTGPGQYEPTIVAAGLRLRRTGWSNPDCECQEGPVGLMDAAGKVLYPPKYQAVKVQTMVSYSDRREGRVTHLGGFVGLPAGQVWVRLNLGGKCSRPGTCVGGKWGVGDLKGRVIVPVTHDYVEPQADLLLRVARGGPCEVQNWQPRKCTPETKWGLIRLEPGK